MISKSNGLKLLDQKSAFTFWSILAAIALLAVDLYIVVGDIGRVQALVTQLALEAALMKTATGTFDLLSLVTVCLKTSEGQLIIIIKAGFEPIQTADTYTDLLHTGHFATCGGTKGILSIRLVTEGLKKKFLVVSSEQITSEKWLMFCQKVDFL